MLFSLDHRSLAMLPCMRTMLIDVLSRMYQTTLLQLLLKVVVIEELILRVQGGQLCQIRMVRVRSGSRSVLNLKFRSAQKYRFNAYRWDNKSRMRCGDCWSHDTGGMTSHWR